MYARGMNVHVIRVFIAKTYGTQVSPDFLDKPGDLLRRPTRQDPQRRPGQ
jgi:hypothetical protein